MTAPSSALNTAAPLAVQVGMDFCRRCGTTLSHQAGPLYVCAQGHKIFLNAAPGAGVLLVNDHDEVLILERAIDPGKGWLDIPGGFCDGAETLEATIARELMEEITLSPTDYSTPEYVRSGIDYYNFGGETLPVLSMLFTARVVGAARPIAADDAASARFIPITDIDLGEVHFPVVRAGLAWLQAQNGARAARLPRP